MFDQQPAAITHFAPGVLLADPGCVGFGNINLAPPASATNVIKVNFSQAFIGGRIQRKPPGRVLPLRRVTIEGWRCQLTQVPDRC